MGELSEQEQQYQLQLGRAGEFTLEDLEANRAGRWGEDQVRKGARGCAKLSVIGFVISLVIIIGGLVNGEVVVIISGLFVAGFCAVLLIYELKGPMPKKPISFIEGKPIKRETPKGTVIAGAAMQTHYCSFEDGTRMPLYEKVYAVLQEGRPHRVYYFSPLMRVLSIEVLPMSWNPAGSKIKGIVERMEG